MKSDALATRFTESGLEFDNGDTIPADVVVFATGFEGNLRDNVRELLGPDVADEIDDFWGMDEEGELRGSARPCGRELHYRSFLFNAKHNTQIRHCTYMEGALG